jgi:hypothetical protein
MFARDRELPSGQHEITSKLVAIITVKDEVRPKDRKEVRRRVCSLIFDRENAKENLREILDLHEEGVNATASGVRFNRYGVRVEIKGGTKALGIYTFGLKRVKEYLSLEREYL